MHSGFAAEQKNYHKSKKASLRREAFLLAKRALE